MVGWELEELEVMIWVADEEELEGALWLEEVEEELEEDVEEPEPVITTCKLKSSSIPEYDVATVVAHSEDPQPHCM